MTRSVSMWHADRTNANRAFGAHFRAILFRRSKLWEAASGYQENMELLLVCWKVSVSGVWSFGSA